VPLQLKFFDRSSGFEKVRGGKKGEVKEKITAITFDTDTLWLVIAEKNRVEK